MAILFIFLVSICINGVVAPAGGGGRGGGGGRAGGGGRTGARGGGAGAAGGSPRIVTSGITTSRLSTFIWIPSHPSYASRQTENPNGVRMNCTREQSHIIRCGSSILGSSCNISLSYGTTCYVYEEQRYCIEKIFATYTAQNSVIDLPSIPKAPVPPRKTNPSYIVDKNVCSIGSVLDATKTWRVHWTCNSSNTTCIPLLSQHLCTLIVSIAECEKDIQDGFVSTFLVSVVFVVIAVIFVISVIGYFFYRMKRSVDVKPEEQEEVTENTRLVNDGNVERPYKACV